MKPYRKPDAPAVPASPSAWPPIEAEVLILVVCLPFVVSGVLRSAFGVGETLGFLGVVFACRALVAAFVEARRSRAAPPTNRL